MSTGNSDCLFSSVWEVGAAVAPQRLSVWFLVGFVAFEVKSPCVVCATLDPYRDQFSWEKASDLLAYLCLLSSGIKGLCHLTQHRIEAGTVLQPSCSIF